MVCYWNVTSVTMATGVYVTIMVNVVIHVDGKPDMVSRRIARSHLTGAKSYLSSRTANTLLARFQQVTTED